MSFLYKLSFAQQALSLHAKTKLYRNNGSSKLYALQNGTLISCNYTNGNWIQTSLLNNIPVRELFFADLLGDGQLILILKTEHDIRFYRQNDNQLNILLKTEDFEDENYFDDKYYDWDKSGSVIKVGHIYPDSNLVGIVGQRKEYGIQIFAIMRDQLQSHNYPIIELNTNTNIFGDISSAALALSDLNKNGHENIIIHGKFGLKIYQINENLELKFQMHIPNSEKLDDSPEELFFPNLTGQPYRDIILSNSTGLFVYQYINRISNYGMIKYEPTFSKLNGWRPEHTETIQFEDIDLDGRQDMIFTGPQEIRIFSFDTENNEWYSLLDNSELIISQRHSNVMKVLPANPPIAQYPLILTEYQNYLHAAKIIPIKKDVLSMSTPTPAAFPLPPELPNTNPSTSPSMIIPSISKLLPKTDRTTLLLQDQLDYAPIFTSVQNTGKSNFRLPLVDLSSRLSNLRFDIIYDGNDQASDILGVGWSLPQSYITMVSPSIFIDDEIYYLVIEGATYQLMFDSTVSNDDVYSFMSSNKNLRSTAHYYKNEEKWEIDSRYIKQIYGAVGQHGAVISSLKGRKLMRDGRDQKFWYLATTDDKQKNILRYTYEIINAQSTESKGNQVTQEVYLKSINDNNENQIIFNYSDKNKSEYDPMLSSNNFNAQRVRTRYLNGYTVITSSYQQTINFIYEIENEKRFMVEIQQMNDITNQPVLQLSYAKISDVHVMQKVTLPTNTSIEFNYQLQRTVTVNNEQKQTCKVEEFHRVHYGNDYTIVSYLDLQGRVVLRIYNLDMSEELYSPLLFETSKTWPIFGKGSANFYTIFLFQHFIAIILTYSTDKELYLLHKNNNKWNITPKLYTFDKNANIRNGKDFIAVADVGNSIIEVISWNKNTQEWEKIEPFTGLKINEASSLISVSGRFILTIKNTDLLIGYKNYHNQWQHKTIYNIPNVINDINEILDKFELDGKTHKILFELFTNITIKMSDNFFFLNQLKVDGMQFYSEIHTFVLDSNYNVVKRQTFKILQDNLETFSKDINDNDGTIYKMAYKWDDNKFKVIANEMQGKKVRQYEDAFENDAKRNKMIEAYLKEISKMQKNAFLLEPNQYIADFIAHKIVCNHKQFIFSGEHWEEDTQKSKKIQTNHEKDMNFSYPIGKKFVLHKRDATSSIKLHKITDDTNRLNDIVFDLEVMHLNQTVIQYPSYLAYQKTNKQVAVIQFSNDDNVEKIYSLPVNENLTGLGNYRTLVTSVDTNYDKNLVFRQQFDIDRLPFNIVATQTTINFEENMKRIMGYEYSGATAFGSLIFYEKKLKIPNNNKTMFGWIEETINFKKSTEVEQCAYNSDGKFVKILKSEEKPHENDDDDDDDNTMREMEKYLFQNSTLLDKTGKLKIAQTFPHRLTDKDFGYFGFEVYEVNGVSAKKWDFDENDIVKNEFSFTGHSFLRLTDKTLKGEFQLADKNQQYIASCWMRPKNITLQLGQAVPYIKAVLSDKNQNNSYSYIATGEIKFKSADWFYVEAILDLFIAKESLKNVEKTNVNAIDFKISIIVAASTNITIDVDHIRFAPLNNIFTVNVYDPKTFQLNEVIGSSGLVERHIYDKQLKEIAIINEYGELKSFETYTKASSMGRISSLKCKIEIQSESGFYENFAPVSFNDRWKIESNAAWRFSSEQLEHITNSADTFQLNSYEMVKTSYGIRFYYNLRSNNAFIKFNNDLQLIYKQKNVGSILLFDEERIIPLDGEILVIAEGRRMFIWIDGGLYFEGFLNDSLLNMTIGGQTEISNLIVFYKPSVKVSYFNSFGDKLQEISLESENVSMITGYRYDDLGRPTMVTRPAQIGTFNQYMLIYHSNFIKNTKEYDYNEIQYCNNPLNEKCAIGMPGQKFSISGPYAKRFSYTPDDLFIENLFPLNQNVTYQIEHKTGDVKIISVFDNKNNRIAWYMSAPKTKSLLCTYKYNKSGKLIQTLPPAYHKSVNTFHQIKDQLNPNHSYQNETEKVLQNSLGTNIIYDENNHILTKTTPDAGKIENIYNENELLKFVIYHSNLNIEKIIYFDYDYLDRLISSGEVISKIISKDQLLNLQLNSSNTKVLQQFSYNDYEHNPLQRGKIVRSITFNDGEPFIEESVLNINEKNVSKRVYIPNGNNKDKEPEIIAINKIYRAEKLRQIQYPFGIDGEPLSITFQYNKLGNIIGIGVPGNENRFVAFTYNSDGQISGETHEPWSVNNFTRQYEFNSAGFTTCLSDKFLTQRLYYTEGYGSYGYNDGTITRTEFKAKWHQHSDNSQLGLNEHSFIGEGITPEISSVCFHELKRMGYLNDAGHQVNIFYSHMEPELPILCRFGASGRYIQKILGKNGFATQYGHSYDYGNYQDLTKAKYFVGNKSTMLPLQADTFAKEIHGIDETMSNRIWTRLKNSPYLIDDNQKIGSFLGHGKRGTSFVNPSLYEDLKNMGNDYEMYGMPLENLLIAYFSQNRTSLSPNTIIRWNIGSETEKSRRIAKEIVEMLEKKDYVKNPLAREFTEILKPYQPFIHGIVRVLFEHFSQAIGEAEFDTESYSIDENGNHKFFYTGFDHYEIDYHNNTNQISNVIIRFMALEPPHYFSMKHDHRGNVIQALHKGIQRIDYNPISNRATKIQMINGKMIHLYYDAKGERVMKRVLDNAGHITKQIHYTRDELGRALVERQLTYIRSDLPPNVLVTAYIYGPKGLIGFIRRDQFYSVITDHEGSIRLVVKDNEVVAAYDYLPYGGLMREFEIDPDSQITYRYTGQEWDEEIGLYNYHARFYDPNIGRFYQIDPDEQYFSPYKYAGNSPVSMVDPNGKFAFLILMSIAVVLSAGGGAYLGMAAANGEWNPKKWDFKSISTWTGFVGGGIGGAFLPIGAFGSFGALTAVGASTLEAILAVTALGLGGAYLSMAAVNNSWDPSKWDRTSPETWNAFFQGIASGSSLPAGFSGARDAFSKISSVLGKRFFITGTIGFGTVSFLLNAIKNEWDFSRPGMYFGFIQVFDDATNMPAFFRSAFKSFKTMKSGSNGIKSIIAIKMALKGFGLTASAVMLTAFYDGLDMNDPTTLFAIVRQMGTVNLHYSMAKKFSKSFKKNWKEFRKNRDAGKYKKLIEYDDSIHEDFHDDGLDETGDKNHLICKRASQGCSTDNENKSEKNKKKKDKPKTVEELDEDMKISLENKYKKFVDDENKRGISAGGIEDISINLSDLSHTIAEESLKLRDQAIQNIVQLDKTLIEERERRQKIVNPNRLVHEALAVGLSDKYAVSAFSGNDGGLGFIFLFGYRYESEFGYIFRYLDGFVLKDNSFIVKLPNTIEIGEGGTIRNFKGDEYKKFVKDWAKIKTDKKNIQFSLDHEQNAAITETLNKVYREREKTVFNEFWLHLSSEDQNSLVTVKAEMDTIIANRVNLETEFGQVRDIMGKKLNEIIRNDPNLNPNIKERILDIKVSYEKYRKHYYAEHNLPIWAGKNCAESHVVTGFKMINEDMKLLRTYRKKENPQPNQPQLENFPPCKNCDITAAHYPYPPKVEFSRELATVIPRQKRSVLYELNQKQIETNSTAHISNKAISSQFAQDHNNRKSILNNIFGWMGHGAERVGGMINGWIDTSNNSRSETDRKFLRIDTSQIDQNGTILLLDVLIRKFTAQKYNTHNNERHISEQEAHGFAINITTEFEEIIEHELGELEIDFPKIQGEIFKKIINCKHNEIKVLLISHIQTACKSQGRDECLNTEKYTNIIGILDDKLSLLLNSC